MSVLVRWDAGETVSGDERPISGHAGWEVLVGWLVSERGSEGIFRVLFFASWIVCRLPFLSFRVGFGGFPLEGMRSGER